MPMNMYMVIGTVCIFRVWGFLGFVVGNVCRIVKRQSLGVTGVVVTQEVRPKDSSGFLMAYTGIGIPATTGHDVITCSG